MTARIPNRSAYSAMTAASAVNSSEFGSAPSGEFHTSARLIALEDIPVARTEIELSAPPNELELVSAASQTRKVLSLVRLHTYPLGIVVLDGTVDPAWRNHAPTIWSAMREPINAHLAADGLPPADGPDSLAASSRLVPRCARRRAAVLASPPRITVIVATRERPDDLRACLAALMRLEYPSYDVVVVDNDPSTNTTAQLIAASFGPLVRYVREKNPGLAFAHNRGLEEATGEIMAFVDDDVVVDRHWLTGIAEGFAAAADVGCITGLILPAQLDTPAQLLLQRHGGFDKGFALRIFDMNCNRPNDPLFPFTAGRLGSGANMAFDAEVLRRLGGFDPALGTGTLARGGDDLAAFFRVVLRHRLVYQPAAVVWHRDHREMTCLRSQALGYGVALGAFLTSVIVHEPRMLTGLLRRLPAGIAYMLSSSSPRNRGRYADWPTNLMRLENRGILSGPTNYAVSRWRAHRAAGA